MANPKANKGFEPLLTCLKTSQDYNLQQLCCNHGAQLYVIDK